MGRLKIFISVILILAVGFLAGAIGSRMYIKHRIEKHYLADEPPGVRFLNRLTDRLDLAEPQAMAIRKIIAQSKEELLAYRRKYRPEFQKLFDETLSKIKSELNESQKTKLDRYVTSVKKRTHRLRHGPPPPPAMPMRSLEEVLISLGIGNASRKEVKALLTTHMAKKEEIKKKFLEERRQEMHQHQLAMDKLDRDMEKRLEMFLSEEQLKKFKRLVGSEKALRRPFFERR